MKLFLINIGKAWSTLRRDGAWRGMGRIFFAGLNLLPRMLSGDILIISSGVGDSARYRGKHVAEELRERGFRVAVTTQYNPFLPRYAEKFSVFVFHRTLYIGKVKTLFDRAKALGKTLIFETDDLVYEPTFVTQTDFYKKMNALEKKLYEHGVGGEIVNDPAVKVCTTTTSYLADRLRGKGKKVFVVRNKLSKEDLKWIGEIIPNSKFQIPDSLRIGYFSGTATHNKDFETISEALFRVLGKYPNVKLVIAGPLVLPDRFAEFSDRIERLPFADRKKHFENIASTDINLAPLVIGDPFCESKSELKWFEAGIVGVPTVAAATQTFREAIVDGVDGFVASNEEEWFEKLSRLIENEELRKSIGEAARKKVLEKYVTTVRDNREYYDFLRARINVEKVK